MNKPTGARVKSRSIQEIEAYAQKLRDICGLDKTERICPVRLFEVLKYYAAGFCLEMEVVEDGDLPEMVEAISYPDKGLMKIKNSVYEQACEGNPRDRFTFAHEIGHLLMHKGMQAFAKGPAHTDFREDAEWQADKFAACLLVDSRLITDEMSVEDIAIRFGVSQQAASTRKKEFNQGVNTPVNR